MHCTDQLGVQTFFSKNLELFALNFLLLPITIYLLALFFEAVGMPISNGFIATQSLMFVNETNLLTSVYLNYLFITTILIFFLASFYFTMGLNLDEWNRFLKVVSLLIKAFVSYVKKIVSKDGEILFVGTKKQAQDIVQQEADRCSMFYIVERWLGGTLTNFSTI